MKFIHTDNPNKEATLKNNQSEDVVIAQYIGSVCLSCNFFQRFSKKLLLAF